MLENQVKLMWCYYSWIMIMRFDFCAESSLLQEMLQCTSRSIAGQLLLATSLVYITPEKLTDLLTYANCS